MTDWTLSKMLYKERRSDRYSVLKDLDVKEFVKRLKDNLANQLGHRSGLIEDTIDELAGEALA